MRARSRSRNGWPAAAADPRCISRRRSSRRCWSRSARPASTRTCTPTATPRCARRSTAAETLRRELPKADIRPAIAHDEIVDPSDYPRFRELDVTPVLSFQWEKPAGDTLGLVDYFGPERMKRLEPAGLLAAAGARIAFGSDWPVDPLDEWFALKVGVTRTNTPDAPPEYRGRLGDDPGLSRQAVLEAATINAAYELHQDDGHRIVGRRQVRRSHRARPQSSDDTGGRHRERSRARNGGRRCDGASRRSLSLESP